MSFAEIILSTLGSPREAVAWDAALAVAAAIVAVTALEGLSVAMLAKLLRHIGRRLPGRSCPPDGWPGDESRS